jgi:hypothetical protein
LASVGDRADVEEWWFPMRKIFFVRAAAVVAALFVASFISVPSFPHTGLLTTPAISVDRSLKGDRLRRIDPTVWPHDVGSPVVPGQPGSLEKIPVGCDSAFSPISAPRLAKIFRRCVA